MKRILGVLAATALLGSVILANYLTTRHGFVPVGFGYEATAGTFLAGFALAARDAVHDLLGRRGTLAIIAVGAVLSYLVADPFIATASAAAFLLAELADFAVYLPLRRKSRLGDRRWAGAVVASNLVGSVVDTVVFLAIAFGWAVVLPALAGQLVGKAWATVAYLLIGKAASRAVPRQPVYAEGA